MNEIDPRIKNIENTFLPRCRSEKLSINAIIAFIKFGLCKIDDLPPEDQIPVLEVMKNRILDSIDLGSQEFWIINTIKAASKGQAVVTHQGG